MPFCKNATKSAVKTRKTFLNGSIVSPNLSSASLTSRWLRGALPHTHSQRLVVTPALAASVDEGDSPVYPGIVAIGQFRQHGLHGYVGGYTYALKRFAVYGPGRMVAEGDIMRARLTAK